MTLSTTTKLTTTHSKLLLCRLFLIWLIILPGCVERQLTRPTPQMDIESQFWVRVLLLDNTTDCTLTVASPYSIIDAQTQNKVLMYQDQKPDATINITVSAGKIAVNGQPIASSDIMILPDSPHILNLNGDDYRGKLKLILNPDANSFDVINFVPLEPYLAGAVGAEMPDYWEPAALQAQAIAARTYCLYIKKHFGSNRSWDVKQTAANQVYLGVGAESAQVWDAVDKTSGQVLVCRQTDGFEELFPAYYSSTCGGHTENSMNVFGDSFEPLAGVPCPYCENVAKPSFFLWPTVQFDKPTVTKNLLQRYPQLEKLGEIENIEPEKQSDYGKFSRLILVKLLGSTGKSDFLRAEDLRLAIDPTGLKLKSTICQIVNMGNKWAFISGRGFGHGVGMCQCGAQAMARQGKIASQILFYYYPGSKIARVY